MSPAPRDFFEALRERDHALVMGVLNVTPDSFSDGGRYVDADVAAAAGAGMLESGAAILDVGAESTRPGAEPVDPRAEMARLIPVLERLQDLPVSVDTRRAEVAARALAAGACMVNDVSGGEDPAMFTQVAAAGAGICLMHMRGDPRTMQAAPDYGDVVDEVEAYLLERASAAERAGIARERILIDPGIGFGKTLAHNLALLGATRRLASHGYPLLLGVSRKSFLGLVTGRGVRDRAAATVAAVALGAREGAAVVRVHDVAECYDAVRVAAAWPGRSL